MFLFFSNEQKNFYITYLLINTSNYFVLKKRMENIDKNASLSIIQSSSFDLCSIPVPIGFRRRVHRIDDGHFAIFPRKTVRGKSFSMYESIG